MLVLRAMVNTAWMSYRYANDLNWFALTNVCGVQELKMQGSLRHEK